MILFVSFFDEKEELCGENGEQKPESLFEVGLRVFLDFWGIVESCTIKFGFGLTYLEEHVLVFSFFARGLARYSFSIQIS